MNQKFNRTIPAIAIAGILVGASGCGTLSTPPTQREQAAGVGALAGGAGGAIIGSMAGGAVAGGLVGMPLGAVAGYYVGDQMSRRNEMANIQNERDQELDRLRRENARLRSLQNER